MFASRLCDVFLLATLFTGLRSDKKTVEQGSLVLLFENVADNTENEVFLYVSGREDSTLVVIFDFMNGLIVTYWKTDNYRNIFMDPKRNIWIANMDETYERKFYIYSSNLRREVELTISKTIHYTTKRTALKKTTQKGDSLPGITYYTPVAKTKMETTKGIDDYTTTALNQKVITAGINHDKTTVMTQEVDAEAFPSKSHLLYIVLGMGGILAFAFIACLQHKVRICLRTDRVSNDNRVTNSIKDDGAENMQDDNLSGNYWTIVSNPSGELRTAIEMNLERHSEPQLSAQTMVHIDIESEEILRTSNITKKEELDGYLNPVHSIPTELSDYIHPVHSDPVNATSACIQYIEIL